MDSTSSLAADLHHRRGGGQAMNESLWTLGAMSIASGVLAVVAAFAFGLYLVLTGPSGAPRH
jgi:hypothetical protein